MVQTKDREATPMCPSQMRYYRCWTGVQDTLDTLSTAKYFSSRFDIRVLAANQEAGARITSVPIGHRARGRFARSIHGFMGIFWFSSKFLKRAARPEQAEAP